jgi:predicted outer membrane repeat protein
MKVRNKTWHAMIAMLLAIAMSTGAYAATIMVEAGGDIAAANATAVAGVVIDIAAGNYVITEAIEIKDGVTYRGAGSAQTIIDCGGVTRAFFGWGNRSQNDHLPYSETGYPLNMSGPKGWVIQGLSIINGMADDVNKTVRRVGDPAIDPPLTVNEISDTDKSFFGGGIYLTYGAKGTLIDVAFDNCNALATGVDTTDPNLPTTYLGGGGAVGMRLATANIIDCTFTNNSASQDGGAVYATNPDLENWDLSIENSTFTNNRARDDGGAIAVWNRNLSVINCVGDGNKTGLDPAIMADNVSGAPDGGFLRITGAAKVEGTSYTDDTPPLEMTNYGGVVTVAGCTITNGEARYGGGIRSYSAAQLIVTDTSFTDCIATYDGGSIWACSPSPFNPTAIDPSNPNAPVGDPGVYIDGVTIDGSIAADDGGGIDIVNYSPTSNYNYIEFPKVVINNTVVKNCRAGGPAPDDGNRDGGGIRIPNRMNVTINNTLVDNCTAGRHGAGIRIDGIVNAALIDRCRISNCINDDISGEGGDGAALSMDEDDNTGVVVTNCIFDNNTNNQDDGIVRIDAGIATVANCTFVGNTTKDKGILYFGTGHRNAAIVINKAFNNLFVNNDSAPGSDNTINWYSDTNYHIILNNGFFGTILDGSDSEIEDTADADMGLTGNFIAATDPLVDTVGGDYRLAPGAEAIDAGTAQGAPDHDFDSAPRPQGAAHDVGAYEYGIMPPAPTLGVAGLIAYYPLDEGSGNTAADASGNELDGTVMGDPLWVAGMIGGALQLDGVNDYVDCGNPSALDFGTGDFTVSAWINMTVTKRSTVYAKGGDNRGGIRYILSIGEGNANKMTLITDDDATKIEAKGATIVNDGAWHHVVGMRSGTDLLVYVDGVRDGSATLPDGYDLSGTSQADALIGAITDARDATGATLEKFFGGAIDDVRIYSYALSQAEIKALYASHGRSPIQN